MTFFRLEISEGDEPDTLVISYSMNPKCESAQMWALVAKEIRRVSDSIDALYPIPLVWREPWVDTEVIREVSSEVIEPLDRADEIHVLDWRRKRGLDL